MNTLSGAGFYASGERCYSSQALDGKMARPPSGVVFLMAFQYLLKNDKPWSFSITVSPRMTLSEVCSLGIVSTGHSGSCWATD